MNLFVLLVLRKVWRYQRESYIKEGQTTQWPKEKGQKAINKTLHRKLKIEPHENQRGTQLSSK